MKSQALLCFFVVNIDAAGCASAPVRLVNSRSAVKMSGVLVAYRSGQEVGRETYVDDGSILRSEIRLGLKSCTMILNRENRQIEVEANGFKTHVQWNSGVIVLENGSWQAYSVAAKEYIHATSPTPVKILIPTQGATLDGTITVQPRADGTASAVDVTIGRLPVHAELDARGDVDSVSIAAQGIEVRRSTMAVPIGRSQFTPTGVKFEPFEVFREGVPIRGEIWLPASPIVQPIPMVLLIAGSGPTDRDGNNNAGLSTDAYRMVAAALADNGIGSLRYDKRGVGASGINFEMESLTIEDFAKDAATIVAYLKEDQRFDSISLLGHSEGGLIALMIAPEVHPKAVVLVATPGRPLGAVVREQLARQGDRETRAEYDRLVTLLMTDGPIDQVPASLVALFGRPSRTFFKSLLTLDPVALVRNYDGQLLVLQGDHDLQVNEVDSNGLCSARWGVHAKIVLGMNHVLKAESSSSYPQGSYADPSYPLAKGLIEAIVGAVQNKDAQPRP